MEMKQLFPEDFNQVGARTELSLPIDQHESLPFSPSFRSLLNIPSNSYVSDQPAKETIVEHTIKDLNQIQEIKFPCSQSEDDALIKAFLAVISSHSSSSSSSSSSIQSRQNSSPYYKISHKATAFQGYTSAALAPRMPTAAITQRRNMLKTAITFYRGLNLMRSQERGQGSCQPSAYQLQRIISERRRRKKLSERFQELGSLLPPGTKKDQASVLETTTEYLSSLKAVVAELTKINQLLEAKLLNKEEANEEEEEEGSGITERLDVRIRPVIAAPTSEASRLVDLQVEARAECSILDLVNGILDCIKQLKNVKLMSIAANKRIVQSNSANHITLRFGIQDDEWDQTAFQEVFNDLAVSF